jgi:hypothetical protein
MQRAKEAQEAEEKRAERPDPVGVFDNDELDSLL